MMKAGLLVGAALLAAGAAEAADLAKAPPPAAPAHWDWAGFYLGANVGGGVSRAAFEDKDYWWGGGTQTQVRAGALVGAQAGYDWQFGAGVLGIVGDVDWASFNSSNTQVPSFFFASNLAVSSRFDTLATLRARAGLTFDRTLLYVTAGPAFGHIDSSSVTINGGFAPGTVRATTSDDSWHVGMAVGAGAEFAIAPHWTAFGEYLYVDLPESVAHEVPVQGIAADASYRWGTSDTVQIARVGINYKFGGGPIAADPGSGPSGSWLPVKAPAAPAWAPGWTGFYLGVNAGGGMARGAFEDKDYWWTGGTQTLVGGQAVAGGQVGYDWQSGATVLGVVGDFDWASFDQSNLQGNFIGGTPPTTLTDAARLDALASIRARAGIALDRTLLYVTAGPAFGHIKASVTNINGFAIGCVGGPCAPAGTIHAMAADDSWHAGIVLGGGAEFALSPHVSVFGEYLYYDFLEKTANQVPGTLNPGANAAQVASYRWGFSETAQVARLGVNYRFGGAGSAAYGPAPALAFKAPPPPSVSWRGFYIGANAGGGVSRANVEDKDFNWNGGTQTLVRAGGLAGGQAGYDWQWGSGVLGLVADADWAGFDTTNTQGNFISSTPFTAASRLDAVATLRARAGLAANSTLVYVTAGPAFGHIKASATTINGTPPAPIGSVQAVAADSSWHPGIAVGGGAEIMLTPHLSAFGEFLYLDFADKTVHQVAVNGPINTSTGRWGFSDVAQVARIGVNYRFGQ